MAGCLSPLSPAAFWQPTNGGLLLLDSPRLNLGYVWAERAALVTAKETHGGERERRNSAQPSSATLYLTLHCGLSRTGSCWCNSGARAEQISGASWANSPCLSLAAAATPPRLLCRRPVTQEGVGRGSKKEAKCIFLFSSFLQSVFKKHFAAKQAGHFGKKPVAADVWKEPEQLFSSSSSPVSHMMHLLWLSAIFSSAAKIRNRGAQARSWAAEPGSAVCSAAATRPAPAPTPGHILSFHCWPTLAVGQSPPPPLCHSFSGEGVQGSAALAKLKEVVPP